MDMYTFLDFQELGMEAHPTFRSNMSRRGEGAGTAGRLSSAKDAIDNDMKVRLM